MASLGMLRGPTHCPFPPILLLSVRILPLWAGEQPVPTAGVNSYCKEWATPALGYPDGKTYSTKVTWFSFSLKCVLAYRYLEDTLPI